MSAIYHLKSAQDINSDILDAIQITYKTKPITIIIEEDQNDLSTEMKNILDDRLKDNEESYITSVESIAQINKKYGL